MIKDIDTKNAIERLKEKKQKEIIDLSGFPQKNPNPVFRVSNDIAIMYANEPAKIILDKLEIKGKKIPKKLIDSLVSSIKKKDDNLMALVVEIDSSVYEFSIVKDKDYFNIYGVDITDRLKEEKTREKMDKKSILLNERNYIARELHDTVTQTLFSANLIAEVLPRLWKKDPASVISRLDEIRMLNNVALTEMRALLFDLRPYSFKNEDLGQHLKELVESIRIKTKIPISLKIVKRYRYPHKVELSFYRIAQEALNNIAKHSSARKAELALKSLSSKITLNISDNGVGFDNRDNSSENLGLIIMQERANMIGASFEIESSPGKGTRILVTYNNIKNNMSKHGRKK
jgi:signal transduction histidine kinase